MFEVEKKIEVSIESFARVKEYVTRHSLSLGSDAGIVDHFLELVPSPVKSGGYDFTRLRIKTKKGKESCVLTTKKWVKNEKGSFGRREEEQELSVQKAQELIARSESLLTLKKERYSSDVVHNSEKFHVDMDRVQLPNEPDVRFFVEVETLVDTFEQQAEKQKEIEGFLRALDVGDLPDAGSYIEMVQAKI